MILAKSIKRIFLEILLIFLAASVVGLGSQLQIAVRFRTDPLHPQYASPSPMSGDRYSTPMFQFPSPQVFQIPEPAEYAGLTFIHLQEAKKYFDEKKALFVDARSSVVYQTGHIPGAVNITPKDLDEKKATAFDKTEKNRLIITYCSSHSCATSPKLATRLKELAFTNVVVFKGGWEEWENAGYPIETSPSPTEPPKEKL